jgi:hypothetical protein
MRKLTLAILLVILPAMLSARSFSDLYGMVDKISQMNAVPGVHAVPKIFVRDESGHAIGALEILVRSVDGPFRIAINGDGSISQPLDPRFLPENPAIELLANDQPIQGNVEIAIDLTVGYTPTQRLTSADYRGMLLRYDQAKSTQGFMTRISMPKASGISLHFESPCAATALIQGDEGPRKLTCDTHSEIRIPGDSLLSAKDAISISELPTKIELAF